jgi:hypothetical protein
MPFSTMRIPMTSVLAAVLMTVWAVPSVALAGPPEGQVVEQPQPQPQPQKQPDPNLVYVQPQPEPQPAVAPAPVAPAPVAPAPVAPAPTPVAKPVNPNRGLGMTAGGFGAFAGIYLLNVAGGLASKNEVGRPLIIPVVGPFITMTRLSFPDRSDEGRQALEHLGIGLLGFALIVDGLAQIATLSLGIAGSAVLAKSRANARYTIVPTGTGVRVTF